jgi:teichoic acid transport system permease protein
MADQGTTTTPAVRALRQTRPRDTTTLSGYLAECWYRRDMPLVIPLEQFRSAHSETVLGAGWIFLTPLMQVATYYIVFGVVLDATRGVDNLLSFLAVGIFLWRFMQSSIMGGTHSITGNRPRIRSLYFPRALLPVEALVGNLYDFMAANVVMFIFIMAVGERPRWTWLLYPFLVALASLFCLGAGLISARINTHVEDWAQFLPFVFQVGLYASSVLFPLADQFSNPDVATWLAINPFHSALSLARVCVLGYPFEAATLISLTAWAVAMPVFGLWYFRRAEYSYGG